MYYQAMAYSWSTTLKARCQLHRHTRVHFYLVPYMPYMVHPYGGVFLQAQQCNEEEATVGALEEEVMMKALDGRLYHRGPPRGG